MKVGVKRSVTYRKFGLRSTYGVSPNQHWDIAARRKRIEAPEQTPLDKERMRDLAAMQVLKLGEGRF